MVQSMQVKAKLCACSSSSRKPRLMSLANGLPHDWQSTWTSRVVRFWDLPRLTRSAGIATSAGSCEGSAADESSGGRRW
jgi:hypothetical protein